MAAYLSEAADVTIHNNAKNHWLGIALTLLLSSQSILVLGFGLAGVHGNSIFTGAFLSTATVSVFLLSARRGFTVRTEDYMFGILAVCVLVAFVLNERSAPAKEIALLILSLAAYPACRCVSSSRLDDALDMFIWISGGIVAAGTIATAIALFQQWDDPHGKPYVFEFSDAAPINFLMSLGFLLLALVSRGLTAKSTMVISRLVLLPTVVFSASLVRFTFIAIVMTLCAAAALATSSQRKYIAVIILVITAGVGAGQIARHTKAAIFITYLTATNPPIPSSRADENAAPSCSMDVDSSNNSVATRKALLRDAVFLIPFAGLTGLGLDSFMKFSCIEATEVHNSILQAAVEFGWIGGLSLALLISVSIWHLARRDGQAKFVLYGLLYVTLLSMAHGRISRDAVLFTFLGLAAATVDQSPVSKWRRLFGPTPLKIEWPFTRRDRHHRHEQDLQLPARRCTFQLRGRYSRPKGTLPSAAYIDIIHT